jgi:phage tail-like protein
MGLEVDGEGNLYLSCCGRVVAFDPSGDPLAVDDATLLALDPPVSYGTDGVYVSRALDSRIYKCSWHKVVLEGGVEPGTRVTVETFTSEAAKDDQEIAALPASRWARSAEHTSTGGGDWDCLVRSAPGRSLWLRLTLAGDGTATPAIGAVRVELPRESSLQRLPAVYREDVESRDFLDRFLSLFDGVREEIGDRIGDMALYFDPAATPAASRPGELDFLTWLASWIGLSLDRHWPVARRRRLLANAHRLYALRGTPAGLKLHLYLYTDLEPRVLEHFRARRWLHLGSSGLGDCAELWGADIVDRLQLDAHSRIGDFQLIDSGDPVSDPVGRLAHRFTVYVPMAVAASEEQRQTLRRIVELAKPAHTEGEMVVVEPLLRIGVQSRVGVDTVIGRYPEGVVAGESELGRGTVLGPSRRESSPPTFTVGERSRIGASTLID